MSGYLAIIARGCKAHGAARAQAGDRNATMSSSDQSPGAHEVIVFATMAPNSLALRGRPRHAPDHPGLRRDRCGGTHATGRTRNQANRIAAPSSEERALRLRKRHARRRDKIVASVQEAEVIV
jgi:hypothetical protein